jgi:ribosome-binding protein aMBF1 (putative translation factor)
MATCEMCGNDYDGAFTIEKDGASHMFCCAHCARQAGVEGVTDRAD